MWYNSVCHADQNTGVLCFFEAAHFSQSDIVGKVPFANGFRFALADPRDNGSAIREGHFAMDMKQCGVYALVFNTDEGDKVYIGSTIQPFKSRLNSHLSALKRNKHVNLYLQRLWNKYGDFDFLILEICERDPYIITLREQSWIDQTDPNKIINFGPALPSPMFGQKHSQEARKKISKALMGKPKSPEHIEKVRQGKLGKFASLEAKEKMSLAHSGNKHHLFGKHHSEETRQKLSNARKGRKFQPHSQETREKISKSNMGKKMSPKAREALLKSHLGKSHSPEHSKKMSESMKLIWQDPEYRAKMTAIRKETWARKKAEAENV